MHARSVICSSFALMAAVAAAPAGAAEKPSSKPYPHYWMSIATVSQSIPGMDESMGAMMGMFGGNAAFGPRRELQLQLESPRVPSGAPQATHGIPSGLNMGPSLPLVTPRTGKAVEPPPRHHDAPPERIERPKGRMLLYWGCGDKVRDGQPRVFDAEKMKQEDMGTFFKSRQVTRQAAPAPRSGWTYGEWPDRSERKDIPPQASLVGAHAISGNYAPDIRFTLDKQRDFMDPVVFSSIRESPAGATALEWKPIPTAIGYFATAMGQNEAGDMVFWSSSELQEMGSSLMDYLTPADVGRLIREKVIMAPSQTTCSVPPVFKGGQGGMLQFIGYGEQLDLVHPPKPKDPKQPWNPQWSVKVRLKSTSMTPLMAEHAGQDRSDAVSKPRKRGKRQEAPTPPAEERQSDDRTSPGGAVGDALRGILGF